MEIVSPILHRLPVNPFSLERLEPLVNRFPYLAILVGVLAALPGYLVLFGFPVIALLLMLQLPEQFSETITPSDWALLSASLSAIPLCGWLMWHIVQTRFKQPRGLVLEYDMAPVLFALISELETTFSRSRVHRIVLRGNFDIRLIRTPRFGLPFYTDNTLVIGLPLLLSLSPVHFKTLLVRRIGQTGGRNNYLSGWLTQLRNTWPQYRDNYAKTQSIPAIILYAFFKIYIPIYRYLSFFAARQDELEADRYALNIVGDQEMGEAISQELVTRYFLKKKYWPQVSMLVRDQKDLIIFPFRKMSRMVHGQLNMDSAKRWLATAMNEPSNFTHPLPPLQLRLENIGHQSASEPTPLRKVAAAEYLETKTLLQLVEKFDNRWLRRQRQKINHPVAKKAPRKKTIDKKQ